MTNSTKMRCNRALKKLGGVLKQSQSDTSAEPVQDSSRIVTELRDELGDLTIIDSTSESDDKSVSSISDKLGCKGLKSFKSNRKKEGSKHETTTVPKNKVQVRETWKVDKGAGTVMTEGTVMKGSKKKQVGNKDATVIISENEVTVEYLCTIGDGRIPQKVSGEKDSRSKRQIRKELWLNKQACVVGNRGGIVNVSDEKGSRSKKQIKKELWFKKLALLSEEKRLWFKKKDRMEKQWSTSCDAHQALMQNFPDASYRRIEPRIFNAVSSKNVRSLLTGIDRFRITADNFEDRLLTLLDAEFAWEHIEMRKYDLKGIELKAVQGDEKCKIHYLCRVDGLSKGTPKLIPTDNLVLYDGSSYIKMTIVDIDGDRMTFKGHPNVKLQVTQRRFDLAFVPSGMNYIRFMVAIREIQNDPRFQVMLFGGDPLIDRALRAKIDFCMSGTRELDDRFRRYNARQKQAIINILEAKCRPNLYVLFGPPGTGKTFTLVETIVQIQKRESAASILICSGSNTCVDAISASLFETNAIKSLVRLSSKHHYHKNRSRPKYFSIEPREVPRYKLAVTTNMMASRIIKKYDYVLIDEAGHSHLPESLIPATKLLSDGCLVLAGDPKQLGPVIKSFEVERLGLGVSLLERMCELEMYSRDHEGDYNDRYITKLTHSYRCDPRILGVCNDLFYDGDLKCLGKTPPSILKILGYSKPLVFANINGQEKTPGNSTSRCNSSEAKACISVLFTLYKMGLEPHQIGIITPYQLQREILQSEFAKRLRSDRPLLDDRFKLPLIVEEKKEAERKDVTTKSETGAKTSTQKGVAFAQAKLDDLDLLALTLRKMKLQAQSVCLEREEAKVKSINKVGPKKDWQCKIDTVDAFQGSEREVILVSSVRTPVSGKIEQCGFLSDAKRFNVTVSRAKWLVIVVGHPAVLDCCDYWRMFGQHSAQINLKNE